MAAKYEKLRHFCRGVDVHDNANHDLGSIKDVAFDGSKMVEGHILSVGGFPGMGARHVAIDADSVKIKYDPSGKKWRANMDATKDELESAPEFEWNASKS